MADRTLDATSFVDVAVFLDSPRADIVRGLVDDYGFEAPAAELVVADAFDRRREVDAEDAEVPTLDDMIQLAHLRGKGDDAIVKRAEREALDPETMPSNEVILGLRELLAR